MANYTAPTITKLGSVHEQTLTNTIYKDSGTGDVIVINGQEQSIPGSAINPS